jgi:hypothetical protein
MTNVPKTIIVISYVPGGWIWRDLRSCKAFMGPRTNQSLHEKSDVLNQPTNHQKRAGSAISLPSTSCLQLQWMPECIVLAATALCLAVGQLEETSFFAVHKLTGCPVETGTNSTAVTFNT